MTNFTPKPRRNKPDPLKQRKRSPKGAGIRGDRASDVANPSEPQKPLFTRETVFAWVAAVLLGDVRPPVQNPPVITEPFKRGHK